MEYKTQDNLYTNEKPLYGKEEIKEPLSEEGLTKLITTLNDEGPLASPLKNTGKVGFKKSSWGSAC